MMRRLRSPQLAGAPRSVCRPNICYARILRPLNLGGVRSRFSSPFNA